MEIKAPERTYIQHADGIRTIYEDGKMVGWYNPNKEDQA